MKPRLVLLVDEMFTARTVMSGTGKERAREAARSKRTKRSYASQNLNQFALQEELSSAFIARECARSERLCMGLSDYTREGA